MKSLDERSHVFLIRLWEERRDIPDAVREWRGSVEEVRSGTRVYFRSLVDLCDHLQQKCSMSDRSER